MAGSVVHVELPSADANRAAAFWNGLFGWGLADSAMEDFDYRMAQIAPEQGVAVFPSPDRPGSGPLVYFSTDDIDASVAKVRELGGTAEEKQPVPTHGWFAACVDTEGNTFSLWQNDPNAQ
jgi:predicted enzyme related to lactoylglutathione lyase